MARFRRILVAIKDAQARSLPAVAKAAQLARATGAELELFHVIDTPVHIDMLRAPGDGLKRIEADWRTESLARLQRVADRLRRHAIKVSISTDCDYPAYEAIVRRAVHIHADLIVAECHGRHLAPWLLRLTDWELLRWSPCPVLLVKRPRAYRHPVVLAALDPAHAFAKPAKLDARILDIAAAVTRALNGSLHAVHAYIPLPAEAASSGVHSSKEMRALTMSAAARAKENLDRALRRLRVPVRHRHLVARHPIDAIQDTVRRTRSSLVVMGAISRSGLKRIFIGNTAEGVLDALNCDILIVKPAHFSTRVPRTRQGLRLVAAPVPVF
ncbi:MAG TPA: universal stress protein [Steroidobacteraceae bacterium]|nr:universal stress protein [Steroidobacteraceae bacterium]